MTVFARIFCKERSKGARRRTVSFRPKLQQLESRWVPASFFWEGDVSSNFWLDGNWSGGVAPPNDGSADVTIVGTRGRIAEPRITATNTNLNSLTMYEQNELSLTLDRSSLTLQNGGEMSSVGSIRLEDSTGGWGIPGITLAGGTFRWTRGIINPGTKWQQAFTVLPGATLHITTGGFLSPMLGTMLVNIRGTINIVGSPGGWFTFGNGQGLQNWGGAVTISYSVTLGRHLGGAPNFDNAYILNVDSGTMTWRDGKIASHLPVSNYGTFNVAAQTQSTLVEISNASSNTSNVGMEQSVFGSTLIDANAGNVSLRVDQGYRGFGGYLSARASGAGFIPSLVSDNGNIRLGSGGPGRSFLLTVGGEDHTNTAFVMFSAEVSFEAGTQVDWFWKNESYSRLEVQGALSIAAQDTTAGINTVEGRPNHGTRATVLTSTEAFTGTFARAESDYSFGWWIGAAENPDRRFVFTANDVAGFGGGGAARRPALDLFGGQELGLAPAHRPTAAEAVPPEPRLAGDTDPSEEHRPAVCMAGTSPAARPGRAEAGRDQLFAKLDDRWLVL